MEVERRRGWQFADIRMHGAGVYMESAPAKTRPVSGYDKRDKRAYLVSGLALPRAGGRSASFWRES